MESTLRKTLLELIFREMVNVSKQQYIGGLIALNAVIKTLQNVVAIGEFYKDYRDRLTELGIRLLTSLEGEFKQASQGNFDANDLSLRYPLLTELSNYSLLHIVHQRNARKPLFIQMSLHGKPFFAQRKPPIVRNSVQDV